METYGKKLQHLCSRFIQSTYEKGKKIQKHCTCFLQSTIFLVTCTYRHLLFRIDPFLLQLSYFITLSSLGFFILKDLKPRTDFSPRKLDLFFTSVSAATVSSMSTVEMEVFSNAQLIVLTVLMFVGGEVFTSMVGLRLKRSKIIRVWKSEGRVTSVETDSDISCPPSPLSLDQIEMGIVSVQDPVRITRFQSQDDVLDPARVQSNSDVLSSYNNPFLKYDSIKFLEFVVLGFFLVVQFLGVVCVLTYVAVVSSAKKVLRQKDLKTFTFALFTTVSTFASCGFVPTNENMMVFSRNSGLLWILIPQVLFGNTLFPSCLRFSIWVLGKKVKKAEAQFLLNNTRQVGHLHLLPGLHSRFLVPTVLSFVLIGFVLFCSLEWNSSVLSGLNAYQRVVGVVFQCVNARHTGETIVDLSTVAPAILVYFVVMMYLPPYTSFLPVKEDEENSRSEHGVKKRRGIVIENIVFSQLSYLAIFIILICITERKSMKEDPINFSLLNVVLEVISAYGNVGFTTGYSCERQIKPEANCQNKWYGFSGKWSDEGKLTLILVMIFGRLKKFNMDGGKGWKLL